MILLLGIYLAAFVLDSPASIIVLVVACVLEPFEIAFCGTGQADRAEDEGDHRG